MQTLWLREGILLVWLLVATPSFCQRIKSTGIEFGAGPSWVSIHDNDPNIDNSAKLSFALDAGFTYALKAKSYFTTRLMFEQKGGKATQTFRLIEADDPLLGAPTHAQAHTNTTSNYISFIPGLRRYFGKSGFFLEGGPFLGFLIGSKTKRTIDGREMQIGNPFTTIDMGASGSFGYSARQSYTNNLQFRLVNNLGLADINLSTGNREWSNSLALIVGIRLKPQ